MAIQVFLIFFAIIIVSLEIKSMLCRKVSSQAICGCLLNMRLLVLIDCLWWQFLGAAIEKYAAGFSMLGARGILPAGRRA